MMIITPNYSVDMEIVLVSILHLILLRRSFDLLASSHEADRALLQFSGRLVLHLEHTDNGSVLARDLVLDALRDHSVFVKRGFESVTAGRQLEECVPLLRLQQLEVRLCELELKQVTTF